MAISTELSYTDVDHLYLDPINPRLGRHRTSPVTPQDELLDIMREWVLDELALSYLESGGFWPHEPLIVVEESLYDEKHLVVVEGNRRLAALKALKFAEAGKPLSKKWSSMLKDLPVPEGLFVRVPYVRADSRADVQAFLGFRHVTGIKQWDADEKAGFIARLIDEEELSYQQVARKIGSNIPTVRSHYIAYRVLLQMEEEVEDYEPKKTDKRFAILRMTLGTEGAKQYLHIDDTAESSASKQPVPRNRLRNLDHFYSWLFGTSQIQNIVTDTRQVSDFGKILGSDEATKYLESAEEPNFDMAFRKAGGDEEETIRYVNAAADNIELSLMHAYLFEDSSDLKKAVARLGAATLQLFRSFPAIRKQVFGKVDQ